MLLGAHGAVGEEVAGHHGAGVVAFERGPREFVGVAEVEELRRREIVLHGAVSGGMPAHGKAGDGKFVWARRRRLAEVGDRKVQRDDLLMDLQHGQRMGQD